MHKERKKERGFTLIELMIAACVVTIACLAFIGSHVAIGQASRVAFERSIALQDAQRVVENIRIAAQTGSFPGNVTDDFPDEGTVDGFTNLTDENITINYTDPESDPLEVTVTVSWMANGTRSMTKSLKTLITQRLMS